MAGIVNKAGVAVKEFLSHSHHDRIHAGKIKAQLEAYGLDIFLAHEDIEPSVEWQDEIVRRLRVCRVFIALLTEAFDDSNWTHQEVGIALGRLGSGPPIMVPINAGKTPVGFLARYQAIRLDPSRVNEPVPHSPLGRRRVGPSYMESATMRIVKSIASQAPKLAAEVRDSLIGRVAGVENFDDAGWTLWALAELDGLTAAQVNQLLRAASDNSQVHGSGSASSHIQQLIDIHKKEIRNMVLRRFQKASGS